MKNQNEYELRHKAIELYNNGTGFNEILQRVQRSRGWLAKWIQRYKELGSEGLKDKSRAPKKIHGKISERMVQHILRIREELETHNTRRSEFSGYGAEVIHWELQRRRFKSIPSLSTISRVLYRHGKTRKSRRKRNGSNQPYPYVKAEQMGDLQQTDLVGPRHIRGKAGVVRFYSYSTVDVAGHTAFASQFNNKQSVSFCMHLIESWRNLGLPKVSQMDNEMAASGGGRYRYSISQVLRLHLLMGIHVVFIPPAEPGRNAAVESFNGLWQARVLQRHNCPDMQALRRTSRRFLKYYHYGKPHRGLKTKDNGTRLPGTLRDSLWKSLRHIPQSFSLEKYIDARGHINFPVTKGRISFVRKVNSKGRIDVNGFSYFIRRKLEGQYVIATVFTHRKKLVVKQDSRIIKSFPFPIKGHIDDPLLDYL